MTHAALFILLLPLAAHAAGIVPDPPVSSDALAVVSPNPDGIFDLAAAAREQTVDLVPNPFRVRCLPPPPVRELTLAITSVLIPLSPADASAIINGLPYSPGEKLAGMTIESIASDGIDLKTGQLRLRLPVQDQPSTLRLLRP